ncbi:hypothetical protein G7075_15420 [Phycicoccus sp. HDW14]|uniref:hypothetical protein n=1 Tax=Phycicoccus sp. HDW14 TaxID=2714941 RepID=UPI001409BCC8|nr:hypothetical protein [Phycicoccus sp. HDW14]QIM22205.1 hypothetical protein G7075_15420 [Phycicoccus sp. HDW14]
MTTPTRALTVLAACAALGLGACEGVDRVDDPAPSTTPSATAATPTPSTSSSPTSTPGAQRGRPTEAEVQVVEVGGGCTYVAVGDAERWALRGTVPKVSTGDRLTVSGAPDDTGYPECPDGTPFLVSTVEPIG